MSHPIINMVSIHELSNENTKFIQQSHVHMNTKRFVGISNK